MSLLENRQFGDAGVIEFGVGQPPSCDLFNSVERSGNSAQGGVKTLIRHETRLPRPQRAASKMPQPWLTIALGNDNRPTESRLRVVLQGPQKGLS